MIKVNREREIDITEKRTIEGTARRADRIDIQRKR